jgi:hypothetical protein
MIRGLTMRVRNAGFLLMVFAAGCTAHPPAGPSADEEGAVRAQFLALQAAIEKNDAEKIWVMLDAKSQADAERAAKEIQANHAKAGAEEKARQQEMLGLSGPDMAGLTGIGLLKTKRFQRKYGELPESKIEKIVIEGDNATVRYVEPDDDHEKLIFIRRDGLWKAWLAMPKASAAN